MKTIMYVGVLLLFSSVYAQEKPKNVSEETTVKTVKVNDGKKITETKVKVNTREEQELKLAEADKNKTDQELVTSPVKVTKTVSIDLDNDPFYDTAYQERAFTFGENNYNFTRNDAGFHILSKKADASTQIGSAYRSSLKNYYIFESEGKTGIGYFNSKGNFVVEYHDKGQNGLKVEEYILME